MNNNIDDDARVNAAFEFGRKNVTQKDFDEVLDREEEFGRKGSKLGEMWDNAKLLFQMLKDYKAGRYTESWKIIAAIVFAMVYFFSPIDVIPDVIPVVGYVDDVAVFSLVLKSFAVQISKYKEWRESGEMLSVK